MTQLNGPFGVNFDSSGNLYVTQFNSSVLVFPPNSSGNQPPTAVISGSNTTFDLPTNAVPH